MLKTFMIRSAILAFALAMSVAAHAYAADPKRIDVPAGDLSTALQALAKQSGVELVYQSDQLKGLRTKGVTGTVTTEEAVTKLLEGTPLTFRKDSSGAMLIAPPKIPLSSREEREGPTQWEGEGNPSPTTGEGKGEGKKWWRLAQNPSRGGASDNPSPSKGEGKGEDQGQALPAPEETGKAIPEILVKGSKILNMDIRRSRDDTQPYVVFDREILERSGAPNLEAFFKNRLTMNTVTQTSVEVGQSNVAGNGNSVVNLRGLGVAQTLILIDGRRIASPALQGRPSQPGLNTIPLAAIERVEILPTTSSGIYGGGATGGVINVILRRDYQGRELKLTYDNTFDTDTAVRRVDFGAGFELEGGRTSLLVAGGATDSGTLVRQDRDFIERGLALTLANNPGLIFNALFPPLGTTPNIRSNTTVGGVLQNLTLKPAFGGTALNSTFTSVPNGYRGAALDGGAPLVANAGKYNFTPPNTAIFSSTGSGTQTQILGGSITQTLNAVVRRQFAPRLEAYLDLTAANDRQLNRLGASGLFTLPATAPNNPFEQDVRVNAPVAGVDIDGGFRNKSRRAAAGLIAQLPGDWMLGTDLTWNSTSLSVYNPPSIRFALLTPAVAAGTPDVLRDPAVAPLNLAPFARLDANFPSPFDSTFKDVTVRASGPVGTLAAGAATLSAAAEYRRDDLKDGFTISSVTGLPNLFPHRSQSIVSAYVEGRIPLVSGANRKAGVEELTLQIAARRDEYTVNGTNNVLQPGVAVVRATNRNRSTDPTLALSYVPVAGVMLRASYGTGFLAPNVTQLVKNAPSAVLVGLTDPRRGNQSYSVQTLSGGNPDLKPEESNSWSAGAVLTPDFPAGLRLSVDYVRIDKSDNIAALQIQQIVNNESLFPGRITRAAPAAGDPFGVGLITLVETTQLNVSRAWLRAWDVALDFDRTTELGDFGFFAGVTYTPRYEVQLVEGAPLLNAVGIQNVFDIVTNPGMTLRYRANGGLTWKRRAWTLGWTARYFDSYFVADPGVAANAAKIQQQGNGGRIPSQMYHDINASYDFATGGAPAFDWLSRVEVQMGVRNVFDKVPPFDAANFSFISPLGDPRLRSYYVTVRSSF